MSKTNMDKAMYDSQESKLSEQSQAFLQLLTKRGILEDTSINDERIRQVEKAKKRNMYHNTYLMLQHYRDIVWALECFPAQIAEELDRPMKDLDALISAVSTEIGMDNIRLEHRLQSVQKSRLLLDRFHEALTVLKQKPGNGQLMYDILFQTYLSPEILRHVEILYVGSLELAVVHVVVLEPHERGVRVGLGVAVSILTHEPQCFFVPFPTLTQQGFSLVFFLFRTLPASAPVDKGDALPFGLRRGPGLRQGLGSQLRLDLC